MAYEAARKGDAHGCPAHEGGVILGASRNVFIGGQPAARILDLAVCKKEVNSIAQGSSTVLINGLPASRLGDATSHGGSITGGEPTVLIGGPGVLIRMGEGGPDFVVLSQRALAKLLPTRSGTEWLRQMARNGRTITLVPCVGTASSTPADITHATDGTGTDSIIEWDPTDSEIDPTLPGPQGHPGPEILLAHEMVHALHAANGDRLQGPIDHYPGMNTDAYAHRDEERRAVGLPDDPVRQPDGTYDIDVIDYSQDVPTENSFREDLGIPKRTTFFDSGMGGSPPY